jgi:GWxTD domain-containing protein
MRFFITIAALFLAPFMFAQAQEGPGITDELIQQPFWVDYAPFRLSGFDSVNVEVYYKIYSSPLSFQKSGEKFRAQYVVDIIVGKKSKQVTGKSNEGEIFADNYEESISRDDFIINKISFNLSPDNYQLVAHLRDPSSGELTRPVKIELKLKDFLKELPDISGLEFVREATAVSRDSQFVRSNLRIIPSVTRIYGDEEPQLIFYYDIYNSPDFKGDYTATHKIKYNEKTILTDTSMFPADGPVTSHLEKISIEELMAGEYELDLTVRSPGHDLEIKRSAEFKIGWSALGLVKNDFETAVEQLRYVATSDEMKKLQAAPESERLSRWNEYWKSQDPTPGTNENEKKDEYYKRLRYADLNFGHFGRDGWKTDMGMVYVTYGPPDEIERHPFDIDAKPFQIWYYYTLKRVFRFVDINGYGEYELLYPYDGDLRKFR